MHVMHFITGLDTRDGGPSVAIEGLTVAQRQSGARVSLVATHRHDDETDRPERLTRSGIEVHRLGPARGPLQRVSGMRQQCRNLLNGSARPDIVHIHNTWEDLQHIASREAHRAKIPYIFRPCGMLDPWSLSQSRWRKKAMLTLRVRTNFNRAAAIHYSTQIERDKSGALQLTPPTIVEPNGVLFDNTKKYQIQELRNLYKLPPGPILLFLGRLHPKKGLFLLADAFLILLNQWPTHRPRPTLLIAGPDEDETKSKLINHLKNIGIHDAVVFTGPLTGNKKQMALQASDLFCLPSYQENFGIAVVEALAGGTPVLISDQVNIHREIVDAGVGDACPLDANAFARLLKAWLINDKRRDAAAETASTWAQSTYSWVRIAESWVNHHYPRLTQCLPQELGRPSNRPVTLEYLNHE